LSRERGYPADAALFSHGKMGNPWLGLFPVRKGKGNRELVSFSLAEKGASPRLRLFLRENFRPAVETVRRLRGK
jgi:hypothetical protein